MREHKHISIADQIFDKLEQDILIGKYARGELLTEVRLSEELGVSRTPIREALRRLEQEHIIEETSRGAVVVGISRQDIADMYDIRMLVESEAAERAARSITEEGLGQMKGILDLQRFYADKAASDGSDNSDSIKNYDSEFHNLLYEYSGKAFRDTLAPIHKKMIRYRKAAVRNSGRARESVAEHEAIYEALKAHDGARAKELMREHTKNARDSILSKEI